MIAFNTKYYKIYNQIINTFLSKTIFKNDILNEKLLKNFFPEHLYYEQYDRCKNTFLNLYKWSHGNKLYRLEEIHYIGLYYFLVWISNEFTAKDEFRQEFFNPKLQAKISNIVDREYEEEMHEFDKDCISDDFYEINSYYDILFEDLDFTFLDELQNLREVGITKLEERLRINIDYYFDLLPMDIQNKYPTKHITLDSEILEVVHILMKRIKYGNLNKLFWNKEQRINKEEIKYLIDNILATHFYNMEVEITWTASCTDNSVYFEFNKRRDEKNKVLLKLCDVQAKYIKKGFKKVLFDESYNYSSAFYLFLCFTDYEYNLIKKYIKNNIYTKDFVSYLNVYIIDLRKRKTASNL